MKHKILLTSYLFALSNLLFGQKVQFETEYLDSIWKTVPEKDNAVYLRYNSTLDQNSKELHYKDKKSLEKVSNDLVKKDEGIIILHGEYKCYDKKDRLLSHYKYENGMRVWEKSYRWGLFGRMNNGQKIHEYFDFTKKFENDPNSAYYEVFDKKGNKKVFYLRKGQNGYGYYPTML